MVGETRRRGAELEEALLEAAWQELTAVGYGRFTFEGVAARAGTSRPVLYRRWPQRSDLAIAALRHFSRREAVVAPDTGSLRDDLIRLLTEFSARRSSLVTLFAVQMGEYLAETGTTPAQLRDEYINARSQPLAYETVLRRAVERGEIDAERLTPRVTALPGDLLRHELLMNLKPATPETITEIVDEVFLPLVRKSS